MSNEDNRFSARAARYVRVGSSVGSIAARAMGNRILGTNADPQVAAQELAGALGGLKGPIMKVAQLLSTIPEALPKDYALALRQLQSQAPPMGPSFVNRRMKAELGPNWQSLFRKFDQTAAASASLGQVHRADAHDGTQLACKLQYPDMQSAVAADLNQLKLAFQVHARMDPAIDTRDILEEISARLREELDYDLEARHTKLYAHMLEDENAVRVPQVDADLSTQRLLTMTWLSGHRLLDYQDHPIEERNTIARAMFQAWWYPFSHFGVIHGDPHLGNYTIFEEDNVPRGINLLDYGCIRTFPVSFVRGVVDLYTGLLKDDRDLIVHAYESWGFRGLNQQLIDALNIWAKFIYGPMLEDRVRIIAEGTTPGEYGRREAFTVHKSLKENGPIKVPREFVFMDRAAIGLGSVFLHLGAELNWFELFNETISDFSQKQIFARQQEAFHLANVPIPIQTDA